MHFCKPSLVEISQGVNKPYPGKLKRLRNLVPSGKLRLGINVPARYSPRIPRFSDRIHPLAHSSVPPARSRQICLRNPEVRYSPLLTLKVLCTSKLMRWTLPSR